MIKKIAQLITVIMILSLSLPLPVQAAGLYAISGTIKKAGTGVGLGGVTISITGTSFTTITNGNGSYALRNIPALTTGDLTPTLAGYTFAPTNIGIASLAGNMAGQNFTATPDLVSISGQVTTVNGGLGGVTISLGSLTTTTSGTGTYTLSNVPAGTSGEQLTPTLTGYTFSPVSISINNIVTNLTGQNFTASQDTLSISGTVLTSTPTGVGNVTVAISGTSYKALTNGNGVYSIKNIANGTSGNLTASLAGYSFAPSSILITNLQTNLTGQIFTATQLTYTISGKVSYNGAGLAGVTIKMGSLYNTTSAPDGTYSFANVPYGTTGNLTATLAGGYTFAPASIHISSLAGDLSVQNFVATKVYALSGKVTVGTPSGAGLANVVVSLGTYTDTTASDGSYNIQNIPAGTSGSLSPTLASYTFNPAGISINNLAADTHGQNFVATLITYNIIGKVTLGASGPGLQNVTVAISSTAFSTFTAADGSYTLANVPYGTSGNMTASLAGGYSFAPANIHISSLGANLSGQNFIATQLFNISGKVTIGTPGGAGLQNVLVSLGTYSDTTASDGSYTLANVPAGTTGDLTPSLAGYAFTPATIHIASLASSQSNQNFTANMIFNISGKVTLNGNGLVGVKVALGSYQAVTDGNGNYSISGVPSGTSGSLTPSKTDFTFTPASIPVTNLSADLIGQNFAAKAVFSISGKVTTGTPPTGLAGVTVALGSFNASTAGDGTYTISSILPGTKGSLIASLPSYTFKPTSITIPAMTANLSGKNFVATQTKFTISGKVTIINKGLKGVIIGTTSLGLTIPNVTTNSSGSFAITNLPSNHVYTVTPLLAGYSFNPTNFVSPVLLSNQTANFAATLLFENISGTVSGLGGTTIIQIRYGPGKTQLVNTALDGSYAINNLPENVSYTLLPLSPVSPIFRFGPTSLVIPAGNGSTTSANFIATAQVVMSGNVSVQSKAIKGVTVSAAGFNTLTDSHGNYSLWVPMGISMTPKATHPYFTFADGAPVTPTINFTQNWSTAVVTVTGHVTLNGSGLQNVLLTASAAKGVTPASAATDANGAYTLTVLATDTPNLASFTVTPILTGYTFSPKSQVVSTAAGTLKNFAAIPNKWSVSGVVTLNSKGLSGVEIDASINGAARKVFTNSKGAFTFTGVPYNTSVTLSAKKTGFSFTPANITFTMANANLAGQNFSAN